MKMKKSFVFIVFQITNEILDCRMKVNIAS